MQPVVVRGRSGDARERNLELGTSWFQHPEEWAAMPADDGPAEWQRISVQVDLERREGEPGDSGRKVDIVEPVEPIEPVALPPVEVSDVQIEQQSLSFSVDQVGVPVVVKVSYFPNWEASGALGPYRIGPNMMVVVPTANEVELTYGRSGADWLFTLAHGGRHRAVHLLEVPRRRPACRRGPGVRPAGGGGRDATATHGRSVGVVERVDADHDPWAPDRFEPHGIAEEDRWIHPRPAPPPTTADEPVDLDPPRWSGDEPDAPLNRPDDPTR